MKIGLEMNDCSDVEKEAVHNKRAELQEDGFSPDAVMVKTYLWATETEKLPVKLFATGTVEERDSFCEGMTPERVAMVMKYWGVLE